MLARTLNWMARLAYAAHSSRIVRIAYLAALALSTGLITLARPEDRMSNLGIYDPGPKVSVVTAYGRYVRLTGRLDMDNAYQTEMEVGLVTLKGGRFIPFSVPGLAYDLYLLDVDLPAPNPDGTYTVVGQFVAGAGQQPNLYFEIGHPTNVSLQNTLARAGIMTAIALILLGLVSWLIRGANYAPGLRAANMPESSAAGPDWLWFGSLGAAYGNAMVRHTPVMVEVQKQLGRAQWMPEDHPGAWSVIVRRLHHAQPAMIASDYGPRPGARIRFEDERGLTRTGVLAARSATARDALLAELRSLKANAAVETAR